MFLKILKRIVISAFLLYGYNLIAVNFNLLVPINVSSLGIVSCLGASGLFGLVLFRCLFL